MNSGPTGQGCGSAAYLESTWQRTAVATPTKGTRGQRLEQIGTKYAQEMFPNTKELCYMSSERRLWTLAPWRDPCKRNKFDESCTQIRNGNESKIQAYQQPQPQHNHNIRGRDCLPKVTDTGIGLKRSHVQEGKSHKATTCLAHRIPNQGDWGFSKGMLLIRTQRGKEMRRKWTFADRTLCGEQETPCWQLLIYHLISSL